MTAPDDFAVWGQQLAVSLQMVDDEPRLAAFLARDVHDAMDAGMAHEGYVRTGPAALHAVVYLWEVRGWSADREVDYVDEWAVRSVEPFGPLRFPHHALLLYRAPVRRAG